jgi:hypothetical protein
MLFRRCGPENEESTSAACAPNIENVLGIHCPESPGAASVIPKKTYEPADGTEPESVITEDDPAGILIKHEKQH